MVGGKRMNWMENLLIIAGVSLDIFAAMECQGSLVAKINKKNLIMSHKKIIPDKLQKFLHCHILFFPQSRHFICNPGQLYYRFRSTQ